MDKARILTEIRRTTDENGGVPLGSRNFVAVTGIGTAQWRGKFWRNWSEAVQEAGFEPNTSKAAHDRDALILALTKTIVRLGRVPTDADLLLARRSDPSLPHRNSFVKHVGRRAEMIEAVRRYATEHTEYSHVLELLPTGDADDAEGGEAGEQVDGAVYMLKLGKHYKIGKSFRVPQRHREIAIELPEKPDVVHVITTDDPSGIEAYWHKRFADKRTNGEWFALSRDNVRAFKRRKFM